ncbi:hypothetical protein FOCG_18175 [Fusarium oxysporum f. sp. radicis-lycopersici 26381]|nr:hypothetical protein FOCG_18175 [Fusarium oxysporum f. sp. radicis-lycopersici 26381]
MTNISSACSRPTAGRVWVAFVERSRAQEHAEQPPSSSRPSHGSSGLGPDKRYMRLTKSTWPVEARNVLSKTFSLLWIASSQTWMRFGIRSDPIVTLGNEP